MGATFLLSRGRRLLPAILGAAWFGVACSGGSAETFDQTNAALTEDVGLSCVAGDEYQADFSGFSKSEVNLVQSDECSTGWCLVDHFQGRVSCPEGQDAGDQGCETPDGTSVRVPVSPQLEDRPAQDAVFCSCRCDGDGPGPFCDCPTGFSCEPRIEDLGLHSELAGSYCVRQ